jgi:hypothetical protein
MGFGWPVDGRLRERAGALRRIMNNDVADGLLLDVREVSLTEPLLPDGDESSLARALTRLLSSNIDSNYNSFGSSI